MSRSLSARRIALVARRDFLGYVKTVGFWVTVLSPILGMLFGVLGISVMMSSDPTRYVSILDETGRYEAAIIEEYKTGQDSIELELLKAKAFLLSDEKKQEFDALVDTENMEAAKALLNANGNALTAQIKLPDSTLIIVPSPITNIEEATVYIDGSKTVDFEGQSVFLSGIIHLKDTTEGVSSKLWTTNPNFNGLMGVTDLILRREHERAYFEGSGITRGGFYETRETSPLTGTNNPKKIATESEGSQSVTFADKVPFIVAAIFSGFLWLTIFSGAYMLLMSMVEEKINKALEMLLASTRFTEILFGKLLGVAALTIASMLPWIIMGGIGLVGVLTLGDGAVAAAIGKAISLKMTGLFLIFFVLGYIFWGSLFMALGSLAESMQDAQTLVTPVLILLTICMMVVPIGLNSPDSPLIRMASFIPFSAPFATLIRLPSEPPVWEIVLSGTIQLVSAIFVVWLSARMFRYGVLSGGGMAGIKLWFARTILRKKDA